MVSYGLIKKIIFSLLCIAISYIVFIKIQLLGINLIGAIGSTILGLAPIALDWFNKYNVKINNIKELSLKKIEELRELEETHQKINLRLDDFYDRLGTLAEETELNKVRAEAYSARGEAQQALSIVNMALDQSATAQRRINDLLSSGVIFKLCETTTKLELMQNLKNIRNNGKINKEDEFNEDGIN